MDGLDRTRVSFLAMTTDRKSMNDTTLTNSLAPITGNDRIQTLDVVRGFALLGILLMNIEMMAGPTMALSTGLDPTLTGADRWADAAIYLLVQGKFFTLFSLLFGMGFAVMSQRAAEAGKAFAAIYWRRGLALFAIGLVHALLIWSGDVLVTYAVLSLFLLALRDVPLRLLPWLAAGSFLAPLGLIMGLGLLGSLMHMTPELAAGWKEAMGGQGQMLEALVEGQRQAYAFGTYLEATLQRTRDFGFALMNLMIVGPLVFGMFLLGSWFVRSGAIAHPQQHARLFQRLRWVILPVGLALVLASFALQPALDQATIDLRFSTAFSMAMLGSALMCLGYMAWIVRGMQSPTWAPRLAWVAPAGRMALTNYLLQSIACTLVFYGYGLGYFQQLPRAWQVPFVFGLFGVQVVISRWWLQRFRFGPMEWVWRSLTYSTPQPMRLKPAWGAETRID
jgi:uncharacterized protein